MRFFLLVISAFMWILGIYYITWAIHVGISPIFGKWVDPVKSTIPFYGWVKWLKGPKFFN